MGLRRNHQHIKSWTMFGQLGYSDKHIEVLFQHMLPLPNLKEVLVDPMEEPHLSKFMKDIVGSAKLEVLTAPITLPHMTELDQTRLRTLQLEDIYVYDGRLDNTLVVGKDFFSTLTSLESLTLHHARFADVVIDEMCFELPSLNDLDLRLPRSLGYVKWMCSTLTHLVLQGVTTDGACEIIAQTKHLDTIQLHLIAPAIVSEDLCTAIMQSGRSMRHLWLEGSHRLDVEPRTYIDVSADTWRQMAQELQNLEVLAVDHPKPSGSEDVLPDTLGNGFEISNLLSPRLRRLRRIILIDYDDESPMVSFDSSKFDPDIKVYLYNHMTEDLCRTQEVRVAQHRDQILQEIWLDWYAYDIIVEGGQAEDLVERIILKRTRALNGAERSAEDYSWYE